MPDRSGLTAGSCPWWARRGKAAACFIAFEPWRQLENLKLSLNKSVLLQSAGGLLGDSSVIARPDQFPLNEGAAVTATTGRAWLFLLSSTPLYISSQDAAPSERALNLCLIQLHQLSSHPIPFNNRKAMSYGL